MVLIMMIMLVYILQQNSDILDKLPRHKVEKSNPYSNSPNLRKILQQEMSRKSFLKKTLYLRHKIDAVASKHGAAIRKPLHVKSTSTVQSRTIVYNRIDKAGSTTLISKSSILVNTSDTCIRLQ